METRRSANALARAKYREVDTKYPTTLLISTRRLFLVNQMGDSLTKLPLRLQSCWYRFDILVLRVQAESDFQPYTCYSLHLPCSQAQLPHSMDTILWCCQYESKRPNVLSHPSHAAGESHSVSVAAGCSARIGRRHGFVVRSSARLFSDPLLLVLFLTKGTEQSSPIEFHCQLSTP
jgi:hypothetical protein